MDKVESIEHVLRTFMLTYLVRRSTFLQLISLYKLRLKATKGLNCYKCFKIKFDDNVDVG